MAWPLLYEINTRCWLRELARGSQRAVRLDTIPEREFKRWRRLGFTHIWLMGIWRSGPLARAKALEEPGLRAAYSAALPDWREEDVTGSPYAISEYRVLDELGGERGLAVFRKKLREHGLKLVLDFVPNHLGIDHAWIRERPELLIQSAKSLPQTFSVRTQSGEKGFAHGKDPYFPAWTDTVQVDYRRQQARDAMTAVLLEVAGQCDGVRCDMAMLVLNEVFSKTWLGWPGPESSPAEEFWAQAIAKIKAAFPDFIFLAEAYWGLEPKLQSLGFDYTYDKGLYDRIVTGDGIAVAEYLRQIPESVIRSSAHFLENHDEPRIAARIPFDWQRAAAMITLGLPGMRLVHEGQLSGARLHVPVQLTRRAAEPQDARITSMYEQLLEFLKAANESGGAVSLRKPRPGSGENCICVQQARPSGELTIMVVNYTNKPESTLLPLDLPEGSASSWQVSDLFQGRTCAVLGQAGEQPQLMAQLAPYDGTVLKISRSGHSGSAE